MIHKSIDSLFEIIKILVFIVDLTNEIKKVEIFLFKSNFETKFEILKVKMLFK